MPHWVVDHLVVAKVAAYLAVQVAKAASASLVKECWRMELLLPSRLVVPAVPVWGLSPKALYHVTESRTGTA